MFNTKCMRIALAMIVALVAWVEAMPAAAQQLMVNPQSQYDRVRVSGFLWRAKPSGTLNVSELADVPGRENRLKEALTPVTTDYDFILLDTPPSLSILTVNVLAFAREILVPCQTHPYAYGALDELLETLSIIREAINPNIRIMGVLATLFDQRTRISNIILENLRADSRFRGKVFDTVIRANTTVAESAYFGKPVVFYRRSSPGAEDYLSLTDEIVK